MEKTICRRRGSGFRAPPGGKKPFADEGGQGLGPPPGGKKPFADEGGQGLGPPPRFWSKIQKTGGHPEPSISILKNRILNWGRGRSWGPPHLGCFGGAPGWKKTICRRRGSGFRAPPGGKKPFADEGGQGLGPPRVEKNHLPTKGVRV